MKQKILFLVNPISGGRHKFNFPNLIDRYLDHQQFDAFIQFTECRGQATELARIAEQQIIVAVGGDGTINEVAKGVIETNKCLGVIPLGSGNGLARTLKIPCNVQQALQRINRLQTRYIDYGLLNQQPFFNVAGVGFDAHIGAVFQNSKRRGMVSYAKAIVKEFKNYQPLPYQIIVDGVHLKREAFMISIANSSQFGNNMHIAPLASISDGWLDVCILKPFNKLYTPLLALKMFNKTIHHSPYMEMIQAKNVHISLPVGCHVHLDGEPIALQQYVDIRLCHQKLKIIV